MYTCDVKTIYIYMYVPYFTVCGAIPRLLNLFSRVFTTCIYSCVTYMYVLYTFRLLRKLRDSGGLVNEWVWHVNKHTGFHLERGHSPPSLNLSQIGHNGLQQ